MNYVDSSNIEAIGYDPSSTELHVQFLKSGLYVYHDVPQDVFDAFLSSDSKGSFFNRNIKNVFSNVEKR
ncbi:MAG: KTSC domain-containing protein [Planctomycetota bacterium]